MSDVVVHAQMLVRRPVAEVFEAFVDPAITTLFWFSKGSDRLGPGKRVRWDWEMFGVGDTLVVREFEQDRKLRIQWDSDATEVEWTFEPRGDDATLVRIATRGFRGDGGELLAQAVDAKGGYTMVLAGLKAWLEHGIELGLVHDQFPDGCPG